MYSRKLPRSGTGPRPGAGALFTSGRTFTPRGSTGPTTAYGCSAGCGRNSREGSCTFTLSLRAPRRVRRLLQSTTEKPLRDWRPAFGFGFVSRRFRPQPARGAAAYLSAYFCHGKKDKMTLRESVTTPNMPRSIVHVSTRLTQATGVTMRELRMRRFAWVRFPGMVGSGDPVLIATARSCIDLERSIRRTLSAAEIRRLLACERAGHDP